MKFLIRALIASALSLAGLYTYQTRIAEQETRAIVTSIDHELNMAEKVIVVEDTMHFSETQKNTTGFSRADFHYEWDARVQYGFRPVDIDLHYLPDTRTLEVRLHRLRLFDFNTLNHQTKKTHEFAWFGKDPSPVFWSGIRSHTATLIQKELEGKPLLHQDTLGISEHALENSLQDILQKLGYHDVKLHILIEHLDTSLSPKQASHQNHPT